MRTRRGFTVVELVVVMVIMAILLVLASFSISQSRANARDTERTADADALSRGIEARYAQGELNKAITTAPTYVKAGTYPTSNEINHIKGQSVSGFDPIQIAEGYGPVAFPGTSIASFAPPGTSSYSGFVVSTCSPVENKTAGSCLQTATTKDTYVYEPIDASGGLCDSTAAGCVRFNLYWRLETDLTTLQQYRSKHQ